MGIRENLAEVAANIKDAAEASGRNPKEVRLVAVSKFHPAEAVLEAIQAAKEMGLTLIFGENRVQEADEKFEIVRKTYPDALLHIIGSLQRNKAKDAVRISSCIQSVDRIELIEELQKQAEKQKKMIWILFELHTGEESKSGFESTDKIREALNLFAQGKFPNVLPEGFMTMAPLTKDESVIRKSFITLRECRDVLAKEFPQYKMPELSMGMSGDYKIAISEGSTMVRIGTAIFGERQY